jgi:hypothetical protein
MNASWPQLDYASWKDTCKTLHLWTQIIGKIRLSKEPWANHSWFSTLYVTSRGLGTSAVSDGDRNFSIEFDFISHRLDFYVSDGRCVVFPLQSETVASFYRRVMSVLVELGIETDYSPVPNEMEDGTPFFDDTRHKVYNPDQANAFWLALVPVNNILKTFRSRFVGKCSPVHFFWGSFDLAVTRFSGRTAPPHPGGVPHLPNRVAREAYSHEVSSCGFWPGNDAYPHAAFYSYAYPAPEDFASAKIQGPGAYFHPALREFLMPYDEVRQSADPAEAILDFAQSTYEAAANLGHWDRHSLEESLYRDECVSRRPGSAASRRLEVGERSLSGVD